MKQLSSQKIQELMMLHQQGNIEGAAELAIKLIKEYHFSKNKRRNEPKFEINCNLRRKNNF